MIEIGDKAPSISAPTDGGGTFKSSSQKGKPYVVYFYPKDDTPGCTNEAIDFTAHMADFDKAGVAVFGVSPDSVARHDKFKAKHDLAVTLISDEDKAICEAWGVWVEKNMYGRKYMGVERSTFLIDSKGKVANVWRKVKVKGHVQSVLEAAQSLTA